MVILKDDGYSLMDTIAAIAIIGILVKFVNLFISGLFDSPKILHKREAAMIARQELYKSMHADIIADDVIQYSGKYRIERNVEYRSGDRVLIVTVYNNNSEDILISLHLLLPDDDIE